jgi:hypothetical protein
VLNVINCPLIYAFYDMIRYDMMYICLLQLGNHPVAVLQYTFTHKQYIEQHKNFGRVRAVPRLRGFYPGICLTTEEKARRNLGQGSRRMAAGTMKIHKHTIRIHRHNNKNT